MNPLDWLPESLATALLAALMLGIVCGSLGTFVVVRRMALTGDMLSHAVLPGVVAGMALSGTRNPLVVLVCAVAAGLLGSAVMRGILRSTRLKPDLALALVLSVFFAFGIALISRYQPPGVQAFLYGQVAAIDRRDLALLAGVTGLTVLFLPAFFSRLRLVSFDPAFARLSGLPVRAIETAFFFLLTVVIVIAMQAVGVVLVTAMLVTPAAAARFCTASLAKTTALACLFGVLGGVAGGAISALRTGLPTGPLMALALTGVFALAAVFGPRHGWLPMFLRRRREKSRILGEDVLKQLWHTEESGTGEIPRPASRILRKLTRDALVETDAAGLRLTMKGRSQATELVRSHRLWERYLTELADYKPDHVHDDAERAEHWIDAVSRRELEEKLGHPQVDPHGSPIPPAPEKEVAK